MAVVSGEYGPFEGADWDQVVFGRYERTGTWSPELVELIAARLLARGSGTLLDVGANIGLVAIPVTARSAAHCIAFEPEPRNHELLRRNVARHDLERRIECHALALDAAAGDVALALSPDNSGDHHLAADRGAPRAGAARVRAERLDAVLRDRTLARPCIMKLDTQGAEVRVLRGAARTLAQVDYLIVEYWPFGLRRLGDSAEALQELLRSHFAYAAVLDQDELPARLQPVNETLASLAWVATDGSDPGFFDLLLARSALLPGSGTSAG